MPGAHEQVLGDPPGRGGADRVVEVGLKRGQLLLQPDDMRLETAPQPRVAGLAAALGFPGDHRDQLAPARDQLAERLGGGAGQRSGQRGRLRRTGRYPRHRDGRSRGGRAVTRAKSRICASIGADQGQPGGSQRAGDHSLNPRRSLPAPPAWGKDHQALDQRFQARAVAAERKGLVTGRKCTSRRSLATSMPTNVGPAGGCSMTHPCECGLDRGRPKRLFGFESGPADGAPSSVTSWFVAPREASGSRPPPSSPGRASLADERYKGGVRRDFRPVLDAGMGTLRCWVSTGAAGGPSVDLWRRR